MSWLAWLACLMWLCRLVVTCLLSHCSTLGGFDFGTALNNGCVCRRPLWAWLRLLFLLFLLYLLLRCLWLRWRCWCRCRGGVVRRGRTS